MADELSTGLIYARKNSGAVYVGARKALNFIEGAGVTLTVADDPTDDEIDVTIAQTAGSVDGSGVAGQVAFWTDVDTLGGDDGLTYSTADSILRCGDATNQGVFRAYATDGIKYTQFFLDGINNNANRAFEFGAQVTSVRPVNSGGANLGTSGAEWKDFYAVNGLGTGSLTWASSRLTIETTVGAQMRLAYDGSNYGEFAVDSSGVITYTLVGGGIFRVTKSENAVIYNHIKNTNSGASASAAFLAEVLNGSAGDAYIRFTNNVVDFSVGLDNTGDLFTVSASSALGTSNVMTMTTAAVGNVLGAWNVGTGFTLTSTAGTMRWGNVSGYGDLYADGSVTYIGSGTTSWDFQIRTGASVRMTVVGSTGATTIHQWLNVGTATDATEQGDFAAGLSGGSQLFFDESANLLEFDSDGNAQFDLDRASTAFSSILIFSVANAQEWIIGTANGVFSTGSNFTYHYNESGSYYERFRVGTTTEVVVNEDGRAYNFRAEGDTLPYHFWLDATATTENACFFGTAAPNWQTMDRGFWIGDTTQEPTGNPASGHFYFSDAGGPRWLGSSGGVMLMTAAGIIGLGTSAPGSLARSVAAAATAITVSTTGADFKFSPANHTISANIVAVYGTYCDNMALSINTGVSVDDATSLYISNAPSNVGVGTLTRTWALWVDAGRARFDGGVLIGAEPAGLAGNVGYTNTVNNAANSSGVGTIKMKGATSRDSSGFLKIMDGTTARYIPYFDAITG